MKNVKYLLLVVGIFFLTGCGGGGNTLTCTQSSDEAGMKTDMEVSMKFDGDKVNSLKMVMAFTATDQSIKDGWDSAVGILDSTFKTQYEKTGITVDSDNDKSKAKYTLTIEVDPNKASKEDLAEVGFEDFEGSRESVKKAAEESGFTCK